MGIDLSVDLFSNVSLSQSFSLRYLSYQFWYDVGDPRVDQYLIIKLGPLFTLSIIASYLGFAMYLGPKLMSRCEPFKLRKLILVYNIMMVYFNLKSLLFVLKYIDYGIALFILNRPSRVDVSPKELEVIEEAHILFVTKFIDLFDTIFFILRKKQRHVSVLHLYHHSVVPLLYWLGFRLFPTLQPLCIFVAINCMIHVLMYSYYALSSFGPRMQPYLWWKKYITQFQMIQFVIYGVYAWWCNFVIKGIPVPLLVIVHIQSPLFLLMFGHFYIKAYMKNKQNDGKYIANGLHKNGIHIKTNGIKNDKNNNVYKNESVFKINGNGIKVD